jgi:hypothetical protein
MARCALTISSFALLGALLLLIPASVRAVPSFARQTGFECTTCHFSWPELTSVGRQFKLGGYTLTQETKKERPWLPWLPATDDGAPPKIPLAAMVQASVTNTNNTAGADPSNFPRNNAGVLQQASLFYAGRIAEHFGAFAQWSYDGVAHHSAIDNVDLRYANHFERDGTDFAYGLTVNNNPTVSDIYNTTPAWGFPFGSSSVAVTPNAAVLIDGGLGQQVVGFGAYALWNQTLYAEVAGYRTADGAFSIFRAGTDKATDRSSTGTRRTGAWRYSTPGPRESNPRWSARMGSTRASFRTAWIRADPPIAFATWDSMRNTNT